jgi:multisubunit Na+/H+ antiporter MnhG subunit
VTARDGAEWTLLALGVGIELVCAVGLLLARDVFDRLHYVAGAAAAGPLPIAAAVVVKEAFSQPALDAVLVAVMLVVLGPILTIATARALRLERFGSLEPRGEER